MNAPLWVAETAEAFWEHVGEPEPFPRSLRRSIARTLPITVVLLSRLHVRSVEAWLQDQQIHCLIEVSDRSLSACLVARYDQGIIFLDGTDSEDEQRFSLAHELAHFLRDYWQPRQVVSERLGSQVLEVLDGLREPFLHERAHALLARVEIGFHVHLMERSIQGLPSDAKLAAAESDADRLAFELLAPLNVIRQEIRHLSGDHGRADLIRRLRNAYGLPTDPAIQYAGLLLPAPTPTDSLLRRLGLQP